MCVSVCGHDDALKCVCVAVVVGVGGVCGWIRLICSNGDLKVEAEGDLRIKHR